MQRITADTVLQVMQMRSSVSVMSGIVLMTEFGSIEHYVQKYVQLWKIRLATKQKALMSVHSQVQLLLSAIIPRLRLRNVYLCHG
jgi:hypothetical protein